MMPDYQSNYQVSRSSEWEKLELQIRSAKDVLVISPPLTGLTSFLAQTAHKVSMSDALKIFTPVYIERPNQFPNIISGIFNHVMTQLVPSTPLKLANGERLQDGFLRFFTKKNKLRTIVFLDNLHFLSKETIQILFEHIRGVSESRLDFPQLNNVIFVVAGHSINLGELDPKFISPFNTSRIINLGDLTSYESSLVVNALLPFDQFNYSKLVGQYIIYLTSGHPYLISLICDHLKPLADSYQPQKVNFEKIDHVVEKIRRDFRDPLIKQVLCAIDNLDKFELQTMKKILNGARLSVSKTSPSLDQLELLGLISSQKGLTWQIRNTIFDSLLREHPKIQPVISYTHFMPRRLFVNLESYKLLYELENDLRDFVVSKMFEKYGDTWIQKFDPNLIGKWTGLENSERVANRFSKEQYPLLSYALFPELYDVINNQWKQIFYNYFKPQKIFTGYFEALENLRNKVAHNRSLRDSEVEQLQAIADRFRSGMVE